MSADVISNRMEEILREEKDARACVGGDGRYGEYGVIGAEQADESHYDTRDVVDDADDEGGDYDANNDDDGNDGAVGSGKIRFSKKKLYGRDKELKHLHSIFDSMFLQEEEHPPEAEEATSDRTAMAFISAYSGCGKSELVRTFVKQLSTKSSTCKQNHLFLNVKYEAMQRVAPFSAFGNLFKNLYQTSLEDFMQLRKDLEIVLGEDAAILLHVFPSLARILSDHDNRDESCSIMSTSTRSTASYQGAKKIDMDKLKFVFQKLFRELCKPNRPLILFIDDLQWIDQQSLNLLQSLISGNNEAIKYFMFIGAYRSNEVDEDHPVTKMIEKISTSTGTSATAHQHQVVTELTVLGKADINEFIADTLKLDTEDVTDLTDAIYSKTLGNPFFVMQAIEQLVRSNAIFYDTMCFCWSWNLKQKQLEGLISDDIVDMVKSKIKDMKPIIQKVITVASYTKSTFELSTILEILKAKNDTSTYEVVDRNGDTTHTDDDTNEGNEFDTMSKDELQKIMTEAVDEGLLIHNSDGLDCSEEYCFAHDKIQEASMNLLSNNDKAKDIFLLKIGITLMKRGLSTEFGEDWMLFNAAHHINSISASENESNKHFIILTPKMKLELVKLNLSTAKLAKALLAFQTASEYVKHGIKNLKESLMKQYGGNKDTIDTIIWEKEYKFSLQLYTVGAEAEASLGNNEKAEYYCEEVLKQKDSENHIIKEKVRIEDLISVYKVKLDILTGKNEKKKGLDLALEILDQFDCTFPRTEKAQSLRAWASLKQTKAFYIPSKKVIDELEFITDATTLDTLEILEKAGSYAYSLNMIPLYVLVRCKMIRWMMKHGLTEASGAAVASFANILMHVYGDFKTAEQLAYLAMTIQERLNCKYTETRTLNTANMNVLGWITPIRTRTKYHLKAYELGMMSGNIEGGIIGRMFSYWVHSYAGMPLRLLEEDCRAHIPKMRKLGYGFYADLCCLLWQSALNFLGESENTTTLTGEAMDEEEFMKKPFKNSIAVRKSLMYVFFGDWDKGAEDALERGDSYMKAFVGAGYGLEPTYRAICLYAKARKSKGDSKYRAPADKIRTLIRTWVKKGCGANLSCLLCLLDAEDAALRGKNKKAEQFYAESIKLSVHEGFHQNAGLACERYADFLLGNCKNPNGAKKKLEEAIEHYSRWGAFKKVEILNNCLLGKP